jgi:hypothetical protein
MIFLNTRYVYLTQLPDPVTRMNQSLGHKDLIGTGEEQFGDSPTGLNARIVPLAITGDAYKFALYAYPQLVCRRCNAQGALVNLA